MVKEDCAVLENKKVAPGHFVLKIHSPRIAGSARPGQFVQMLCSDSLDPLLGRPFSFLSADEGDFSVLYQVVGRGTAFLSKIRKGESLTVLGPFGNGFSLRPPRGSDLLLVGGGVGIPPLYHLARVLRTTSGARRSTGRTWSGKWSGKNVHVFLGARDKSLLLCEREFKKLGVHLHLATDDGSKGKKGFVTDLLEDFLTGGDLQKTRVYGCGPTPMLKAVSVIAKKFGVGCELAVEVPMACGFGACLGCAIKVRKENDGLFSEHRFAIACKEGPVFSAGEILWD